MVSKYTRLFWCCMVVLASGLGAFDSIFFVLKVEIRESLPVKSMEI